MENKEVIKQKVINADDGLTQLIWINIAVQVAVIGLIAVAAFVFVKL